MEGGNKAGERVLMNKSWKKNDNSFRQSPHTTCTHTTNVPYPHNIVHVLHQRVRQCIVKKPYLFTSLYSVRGAVVWVLEQLRTEFNNRKQNQKKKSKVTCTLLSQYNITVQCCNVFFAHRHCQPRNIPGHCPGYFESCILISREPDAKTPYIAETYVYVQCTVQTLVTKYAFRNCASNAAQPSLARVPTKLCRHLCSRSTMFYIPTYLYIQYICKQHFPYTNMTNNFSYSRYALRQYYCFIELLCNILPYNLHNMPNT